MLVASSGNAGATPARSRRRVRTCKMCVRRRVLCDATYPKCRKCVDGGLECPGVLEPLSFTVHDESQAQQANAQPQQPASSPDLKTAMTTLSAELSADGALHDLQLSTADFAKGLFLQGHPDILRASGIADPFFECLKPVLAGQLDPHVDLSAHAVSLAALGQSSDRNEILKLAAEKYSEALRATQLALYDPNSASSDATLTAVKLLMAYEFLTSDAQGASSWIQHVFGQLAITIQRGSDNFTTPEQIQLLYTTFFHNALCALYSATPLSAPAGGWLPPNATENPQTRMLRLTCETITLRVTSASLHSLPDSAPHKVPEIHLLMQRAERIIEALMAWHDTLPRDWNRTEIDARYRLDVTKVQDSEIWPGPLFVYKNLDVAHYYNLNRMNRIYALSVAVRAMCWLETQHGGRTHDSYDRIRHVMSQMFETVGEVCADVPFYLGLKQLPKDLRHLSIDRLGLNGKGGLSLWCWIFTCMSVEGIPEVQRDWMRGRMRYIGDEVKYRWASWLADNTAQTLIFDNNTNLVTNLIVGFLEGVQSSRSQEIIMPLPE